MSLLKERTTTAKASSKRWQKLVWLVDRMKDTNQFLIGSVLYDVASVEEDKIEFWADNLTAKKPCVTITPDMVEYTSCGFMIYFPLRTMPQSLCPISIYNIKGLKIGNNN